ncbi:hypothetical protein VE02_08864 [Pseudogymnoascus sp. 03VT05]|nr:hypothetical protein VE02_08864 [Pseudogymnoascus sp. 03VT05]
MAASRRESYSGPGVQNAEARSSLTDARPRREQPTKKGGRVTRSQSQGESQFALVSPNATNGVMEKDSSIPATVNLVGRSPSSTSAVSASPAITNLLTSPDEPTLDVFFMTPEGLSQHEVDGEALYQSMFTDGSQPLVPWTLATTDWISSPMSDQQSVSTPSPLLLPHQLQQHTADLARPNIRNLPQDHQPIKGYESLPSSRTLNTPSSSQGTYLRPDLGEVFCNCIGAMAQLLEDTGAQQGSTSMAAGVDILLMHLYRGIHTCTDVLECTRCDTCSGSSMLVAITTEQLSALSADVGAQLMEHHLRQETANVSGANNDSPGADVLFGNMLDEVEHCSG